MFPYQIVEQDESKTSRKQIICSNKVIVKSTKAPEHFREITKAVILQLCRR